MNPPTAEALYVISLREVFWGGTLVAVTMAMHGCGTLVILRIVNAIKERIASPPNLKSGLFIIILASWLIMLLHLTEVAVWAVFFLWKRAFPNHSLCYYFSLNEYTTLGSNYNLPLNWRLLEGMLAMAGLLTFAWSTGILFTLAQEFQDQQMDLLKKRRTKPLK